MARTRGSVARRSDPAGPVAGPRSARGRRTGPRGARCAASPRASASRRSTPRSRTSIATSENTPFGLFAPETDIHQIGFDAAWEVDSWGRVRRLVEAADADLEASVEDARDIAVTVAAETALNYVELRLFQRRRDRAHQRLAAGADAPGRARRFESGLVTERDVAQAITQVESTRSRVPALEVGLRAAENRLAVLLGLTPAASPPSWPRLARSRFRRSRWRWACPPTSCAGGRTCVAPSASSPPRWRASAWPRAIST
ncbi:MAG: TolC family protein [Planctomycetota bacterium]